jgi:voltage-gated potassium channel
MTSRHSPWSATTQDDGPWHGPVLGALVSTIPAFYLLMLPPHGMVWLARLTYAVAGVLLLITLWRPVPSPHRRSARSRYTDTVLAGGLLLSAVLPASVDVPAVLGLRLALAMLTLMRLVWSLHHLVTRSGLTYLMLLAISVLALCGVGFWWLEPTAKTFADGLWLAFTTAATVRYGDLVPTTAASRIFSVFVVLLGYAVLSLVTAAIAAMWVETGERRMEHDLLRAMHRDVRDQLAELRAEITSLRQAVRPETTVPTSASHIESSPTLTAPSGATAATADPQKSAHPPSQNAGW